MSQTCLINKYTIHAEQFNDTPHPNFDSEGTINKEEGILTFALNEE